MSASASKKRRQQKNEQGMNQFETAQEAKKKEQKKEKKSTIIFCIAAAVAVIALIVFFIICGNINQAELDKKYADTIGASTTTIAKVGDVEISAAMYNYFYKNANEPETLDDLNHSLGETLNLYAAAKKEGYLLSDEDNQWIEDQISELREYAKQGGSKYKTDYLLYENYGEGCNEANFREYLTITKTAESYYNHLRDSFDPGEDAINAAYEEAPEKYDIVVYDVYTAHVHEDEAEQADGEADAEPAEGENDAAPAEDGADAEAAENASDDALKALAEEAEKNFPEDDEHTTKDRASSYESIKSSYTEEAADWLFDGTRKANDVKYFAKEDTDGNVSYIVFRFKERDDNDYCPVKADVAYFFNTSSEDSEEDAAASLEEKIQGVVSKANEEKPMSSEDFNTLVSDAGGYGSGGTSQIGRHDLSQDVTNFLYSKDRIAGDTQYFDVDGMKIVVRFDSIDEDTVRTLTVKNSLLSDLLEEKQHTSELELINEAFEKTRVDASIWPTTAPETEDGGEE